MKRLFVVFSVFIIASMLLTACGPKQTEPLQIWSFTNEIITMAKAYEKENPGVKTNYTMIPMTNGEYQTKLMATLGTEEAPCVVALEAAFVKSYVESRFPGGPGRADAGCQIC